MITNTQTQAAPPALNIDIGDGDHLPGLVSVLRVGAVALVGTFWMAGIASGQAALGKMVPTNTLSGTEEPVTYKHTLEPEMIDPDLWGGPGFEVPAEAANEREGLSYSVGPYGFTEMQNFSRTPTELKAETLSLPTISVGGEAETPQSGEGEEALDGIAYAPLNLPDEAPVFGMSIFVHDSCLIGSITVKLMRRSLTSGVTETLIEVSSTGASPITSSEAEVFEPIPDHHCDRSETLHVHTGPGHTHRVNNDNHYYYLEVTSPERSHSTSSGHLKLYGVIIDYL